MNNYEIHFRFNGSFYKGLITCKNGFKARDLVKAKYPGSQITSVSHIK